MSDIKLFRVGYAAEELPAESAVLEKSLQTQMEQHLPALLGVTFLASEYATGKKHGGRIDTLGIDENGVPVIIEYKRSVNENVINQGLFYLDWLLDHKAEFELLVMKQLGPEKATDISWANTRLLCIASDYTRYDQHAVAQINRNIELIRYKKYPPDLLLLELVNATAATGGESPKPAKGKAGKAAGAPEESVALAYLHKCSPALQDLYAELRAFAEGLGDDVQVKELKVYIAFRRLKNFMCVEPHPQKGTLTLFLRLDPSTVELREGFTTDVSKVGHFGTGDLQVSLGSRDDLAEVMELVRRAYEAS